MPEASAEDRIDAALVARALHGQDPAAFGQLMHRHQGRVRAQLRRLTHGDHAWADDLAQEAFLGVWRNLRQFRGDARFSTWLHRIAFTTYLQARRKRGRDAPAATDASALPAGETPREALRLDVMTAISRLPQDEQLSILHCYHLDLSHEEAAYVLGMPVGTVKTHIARGKARLKRWLAAWNPDSEHTHD
jgi:RNA polymerase sigma factor (sigma-70 family)